MDRRVKERLVGATILVVLVVLFVPEFLSGPHQRERPADPAEGASTRTYVVDLDHIATAPPAQQPPAATAAAPLPEGASAAATPPPPAVPEAPAASAAPATRKPPTPAAGGAGAAGAASGWTVQLGSFASRANAETLLAQLKAEGFTAYQSPIGTASATRYRVRIGPLADRAAAGAMMSRLQAHKHAATLVPPSG